VTSLCPVIFTWNQVSIIKTPGTIISGGIAFPFVEMHSTTVTERRF
jgi:hypothetical protein